MKLDVKDVSLLANSLRMEISEEEAQLQKEKLNDILDYVKILDEIKDIDKEELIYVHENINVFRKDEPGGSMPLEETLQNAPEEADGMFRVPRIV